MQQPSIFNDRLHSPFFIYFRRDPQLSDEQILAHFGLGRYERVSLLPKTATYAVITDAGDWTLLADDWLYRLWHMPTTRNAIESLGQKRDVFAWSVGDCDESFEYMFYRGGELVRQLTVDSPNYSDQVVRRDFGDKLPLESELHDLPIEHKIDRLCSDIGIVTAVTRDGLRLYCKPYRSNLDSAGGLRNF